MGVRINVGCGMTVTVGWVNLDNSLSLTLSKLPSWVARLMHRIGLLDSAQYRYVNFARAHGIIQVNAAKRLPFQNGEVEIIYSSHMLEHLDRKGARNFLDEALRVLMPGGMIRVSVPDLKLLAENYVKHQDADRFIESMGTCIDNQRSLQEKVKYILMGSRHHSWMYDGKSLCRLLLNSGFEGAKILPPGKTMIPDSGALDLVERADASVYVEAKKPEESDLVQPHGHKCLSAG
ncbi:MAG: methyltransferase domain-containing protein [Methylococcus sp.]|nr:methyltransferase domain-containing protein [Methylococcus sp.]